MLGHSVTSALHLLYFITQDQFYRPYCYQIHNEKNRRPSRFLP
ncbi:hypothetical protein Q7C_454 [Methylophaga frappieri]|uniref:Uncharacterized protein n=1 Tax=Methylophaga frappieri (strain ATCC BAA-2434 / DSM 25690 / JAM7) TaxID=754477 RepID=I1YFD6_METFJ|nr:hypothetical protein Q7C_454 [Methylophaga frappieri]